MTEKPATPPDNPTVPDHGEVVHRRVRISWAWLFPLLAAAATAWLFWTQWKETGPTITIRFDDVPGLQAGKSMLIYRGVPAGKVTAVRLDLSLKKAVVSVRLMAYAADLARKGNDFWIERPEVTLQQIDGLSSIIQGNSIQVRVHGGTEPSTQFEGLAQQPLDPFNPPALRFKLKAAAILYLDRGAPVFYRGVQVGAVLGKSLDDRQQPFLDVKIDDARFKPLVRRNTRFWYQPAASLHLSPQGVKLDMPGVQTLVQGGVEFETFGPMEAPVENGDELEISANEQVARASGAPIEITFDEARGLAAGSTQVCYRGQAIGLVESAWPDPASGVVRATVRLEPGYQGLATRDAVFTLVRPRVSLDGVSGLETIVTGVYVACEPGAGEPARSFIGRTVPGEEWDRLHAEEAGLHLVLQAKDIPAIGKGAPVLYRGVPVGAVTEKTIARDGGAALGIVVRPEFAAAVAGNARFWRVPATTVKAGPGVLNVSVEGLETLLRGGVAFDVFSPPTTGPKNGTTFELFADERVARLESPPIRITFENGQGLLAGQTQLRYLGVPAGLVESVVTSRGRVQVTARFEAGHDDLRGAGASFSIVRPQISLQGVSGLEALVSGTYIECQPGSAASPEEAFTGRIAGAPIEKTRDLEVVVTTSSTNITVDAPVFYRGVRVGKVVRKTLAPDARQVGLVLAFDAPYGELVRENSRFWGVGSVKASVGFLWVSVRTEPLDTLLRGGIAFATPEEAKAGAAVKNGHEFGLASSPRSEWLRWAPRLRTGSP